jgi:hypothetical protein
MYATPSCDLERHGDVPRIVRAGFETLSAYAGAIVGLLALFETLHTPRSFATRAAWLIILGAGSAVFVFQQFDARITLAPAAAALWWLAARAAWSLVVRQPSLAARLGALALFGVVPLLHMQRTTSVSAAASSLPGVTARSIADSLDGMTVPAALLSADLAHDLLTTWWRAGGGIRESSLLVVDRRDPGLGDLLGHRTLYAFASDAPDLAARGLWIAPVNPPRSSSVPVLWRALASAGCEVLGRDWREVTATAADSQVSFVFSQGGPGPHAIVYAAVPSDGAIWPYGWSSMANRGYRVTGFDLTNDTARQSLYETAMNDGLAVERLPTGTNFVARLRIEHVERTPGALGVVFNVAPAKMIARLESPHEGPSIRMCRSAHGLAIVGYPEAPAISRIDLLSATATGRGWHSNERAGDVQFRWTAAPTADLRFIAMQPVPLALRLEILENAAGGSREPAAVSLNGVAATCEPRGSACDWVLPIQAVKRGVNALGLHAPVVLGPPADPRLVGLKVTGAELRAVAYATH